MSQMLDTATMYPSLKGTHEGLLSAKMMAGAVMPVDGDREVYAPKLLQGFVEALLVEVEALGGFETHAAALRELSEALSIRYMELTDDIND